MKFEINKFFVSLIVLALLQFSWFGDSFAAKKEKQANAFLTKLNGIFPDSSLDCREKLFGLDPNVVFEIKKSGPDGIQDFLQFASQCYVLDKQEFKKFGESKRIFFFGVLSKKKIFAELWKVVTSGFSSTLMPVYFDYGSGYYAFILASEKPDRLLDLLFNPPDANEVYRKDRYKLSKDEKIFFIPRGSIPGIKLNMEYWDKDKIKNKKGKKDSKKLSFNIENVHFESLLPFNKKVLDETHQGSFSSLFKRKNPMLYANKMNFLEGAHTNLFRKMVLYDVPIYESWGLDLDERYKKCFGEVFSSGNEKFRDFLDEFFEDGVPDPDCTNLEPRVLVDLLKRFDESDLRPSKKYSNKYTLMEIEFNLWNDEDIGVFCDDPSVRELNDIDPISFEKPKVSETKKSASKSSKGKKR